MLSKIEQSPDPQVCGGSTHQSTQNNALTSFLIVELRGNYTDATSTIRRVIEETIRHMSPVLIDTRTGRPYDRTRQAAAFEALPVYNELRSSMTTGLDLERIQKEVKDFYRYVMLSHREEASLTKLIDGITTVDIE